MAAYLNQINVTRYLTSACLAQEIRIPTRVGSQERHAIQSRDGGNVSRRSAGQTSKSNGISRSLSVSPATAAPNRAAFLCEIRLTLLQSLCKMLLVCCFPSLNESPYFSVFDMQWRPASRQSRLSIRSQPGARSRGMNSEPVRWSKDRVGGDLRGDRRMVQALEMESDTERLPKSSSEANFPNRLSILNRLRSPGSKGRGKWD